MAGGCASCVCKYGLFALGRREAKGSKCGGSAFVARWSLRNSRPLLPRRRVLIHLGLCSKYPQEEEQEEHEEGRGRRRQSTLFGCLAANMAQRDPNRRRQPVAGREEGRTLSFIGMLKTGLCSWIERVTRLFAGLSDCMRMHLSVLRGIYQVSSSSCNGF